MSNLHHFGKKIHRLLCWVPFFIVGAIVASSFLSCSRIKSLTNEKTVYVQDSSKIKELHLQVDSFREVTSSLRTEKEHIREELETVLSGTSGEPDTIYPEVPVRTRRLSAGSDYIDVSGQWIWLDYKWYRAPSISSTKKTTDSSSTIRKEYQLQLSEKDKTITSLRQQVSALEKKEVKKIGIPTRTTIFLVLIAAVAGLLVGKFVW